MTAAVQSNIHPFQFSDNSIFDCGEERADKIKKVALGVIGFLASIPILKLVDRAVVSITNYFNLSIIEEQEVIQLWRFLGSTPIIGIVLQTMLLAYIVIIGPVIEETIFRHYLYPGTGPDDGICHQIGKIMLNGFAFGLCHLSPFQGVANLPIFCFTFVLGCIFATLREISGDILAPTVAHILNNGTAMFFFLT